MLKKRVSRPGQGKRGGFRVIVATRLEEQWFFIFGFAKNELDNIDEHQEAALKKMAVDFLDTPAAKLVKACEAGELKEVAGNGPKDQEKD